MTTPITSLRITQAVNSAKCLRKMRSKCANFHKQKSQILLHSWPTYIKSQSNDVIVPRDCNRVIISLPCSSSLTGGTVCDTLISSDGA